MVNLKLGPSLLGRISLNFEMDAATTVFGDCADYIIVRDSLSTHSGRNGEILHKGNDLEVIVAIPREKIKKLPGDQLGAEKTAIASFLKRGNTLDNEPCHEVNMVRYEGSFSNNFLKGLIEMSPLSYSFVYYLVEAESFLAFAKLQPEGNLIWHERNRTIDKKQGPGFDGKPVIVTLSKMLAVDDLKDNRPLWHISVGAKKKDSPAKMVDLFSQPPLAEGKYYGGLQTTLLLPGILFYEREEGLVSGLREQVWKEFVNQFVKEVGPIPNERKRSFSPINVFDTRNRFGWHRRGDDYIHQKMAEELVMTIYSKNQD